MGSGREILVFQMFQKAANPTEFSEVWTAGVLLGPLGLAGVPGDLDGYCCSLTSRVSPQGTTTW